ncbi:hypothetical protein DQ04_02251070 [Trypanosoma grayi]|uniref:hypothetical protein n=1 Tax=Trypanosoma grayi TaxID=71804 RepID=UPI0004F407D8|nr:hypothetical protein DQ04_02251070 [Trypanosoma grayi]KEG11817.1 hypothetical protein DQ04_02251070 [Trypanosoma grayi]
MSLQRNRLLSDSSPAWQIAEDQPSNISTNLRASANRDKKQYYNRSRQWGSGANSKSVPSRWVADEREHDLMDESDRLPASYRRSRSASRNHYPTTEQESRRTSRALSCRWVGDDDNDAAAAANRSSVPGCPPRGGPEAHVSWNSAIPHAPQHVQPSSLLLALVRDVAARRGVRCPPIPPEVIIAFESSVARGTFMLKFVTHGAPHERFFVIKFLYRKSDLGELQSVLCWHASSQSWTMRRCLPLADLIAVIDGGDGHPAVKKRMVRPGVIKGSYFDLKANYLNADWILQWHFRSSSGEEELLAVKLPSRQFYIAWSIVTDFFCKIGCVDLP